MRRPLRASVSGVEGSCKEPVPKKLLELSKCFFLPPAALEDTESTELEVYAHL